MSKFKCTDPFECGNCHAFSEPYMVRTPLWLEAVPRHLQKGVVCLNCLQAFMKRPLVNEDFDFTVPINQGILFGYRMGWDASHKYIDKIIKLYERTVTKFERKVRQLDTALRAHLEKKKP